MRIFMNSLLGVVFLCNLSLSAIAQVEAEHPAVSQYKEERKNVKASERFDLAEQKLLQTDHLEVMDAAIEELLRYTNRKEKLAEAKQVLGSVIEKKKKKSKVFQKAALAQGRLLMREGKPQQAMANSLNLEVPRYGACPLQLDNPGANEEVTYSLQAACSVNVDDDSVNSGAGLKFGSLDLIINSFTFSE